MINAALVAALALASQLQTHPTGLPSVGPSRANSLRTAPIMDKLYEQAGKPALDFDFARYKDLHDNASGATSLINFSRSAAQSPGTYVGSDGLIHTAAVNLALYSEQFENAVWSKNASTVLANQAIAPDGKQTADELKATSTTEAGVYRIISTTGVTTSSVYVKKNTARYFVINTINTGRAVWFDLDSGTIANQDSGVDGAIVDVGNGWYRCSANTNGANRQTFYVANSDSSFAATVGHSVYIWGAQLEQTDPATMAPTAYIHTTSQALAAPRFDHDPVTGESLGLLVEEARANLVWPSEDFTSAARWPKSSITVNSTTEIAPDGTATATRMTSTGNAFMYQSLGLATQMWATSIWIKSDNLSSIKLGTNAGQQDVAITSDWTRVSVSAVGNTWFIIGSGGSFPSGAEIYIWGAQLEDASFPTSYIPTTGTSQYRYADVAAVQDEDFATTNLLSYSESFDVGWSPAGLNAFGSGSVVNATVSPDGQTTAEYIQENVGLSQHGVYTPSVSFTNGVTYTFSVYVKPAERSIVSFVSTSGIFSAQDFATYDLSTESVTNIGSNGSASIKAVGDGWYRLTRTLPAASTSNGIAGWLMQDDPLAGRGASYTGDGTSGLYLWGASVTATEYPVDYVTTRNLLTDSQDFERGAWVKTNATIGNDVAQAPDGTLTADKLKEDSSPSVGHQVGQSLSTSIPTGQISTASVYVKAQERNWIVLEQLGTLGGGYAWFDVANGTIGSQVNLSHGATITDAGNGWYRCTISDTATGTSGQAFRIYLSTGNGVVSYSGDNTSGVLVWGAQLEPGTTPSDYVRTVDTVGKDYQWYEPTEGTVFVGAQASGVGSSSSTIAYFSNYPTNSPDARLEIRYATPSQSLIYSNTPTTSFEMFFTRPAVGSKFSASTAYKKDDFAGIFSGQSIQTDGSGNVAYPITTVHIGQNSVGTNKYNGHIKRLTYWPRRQSNSTLQVITQ